MPQAIILSTPEDIEHNARPLQRTEMAHP